MQSKRCSEVLDLCQRQGLSECVGQCVVHGAGCGANESCFDGLMMVHVEVLTLRVVLVAAQGHHGCW